MPHVAFQPTIPDTFVEHRHKIDPLVIALMYLFMRFI